MKETGRALAAELLGQAQARPSLLGDLLPELVDDADLVALRGARERGRALGLQKLRRGVLDGSLVVVEQDIHAHAALRALRQAKAADRNLVAHDLDASMIDA